MAHMHIPGHRLVHFGSEENRPFNIDPWPFGEFAKYGDALMYWAIVRAESDDEAKAIIEKAYEGMNATIIVMYIGHRHGPPLSTDESWRA